MKNKKLSFDLLKELANEYGDNSYANVVTSLPFSYYVTRVQQIGLINREMVLDVGCGFGQWSAALSLFNKSVIGIDINKNRIAVGNKLLKTNDFKNVRLELGNALSLENESSSVDILFCYGVIMFMDFEKAIQEFNRVLKIGGLVYINSNGKGWWLRLAAKNFLKSNTRNYSLRGFFFGSMDGVIPNSSSLATIDKKMAKYGFEVISKGYDGTITSDPNLLVDMAFYKPQRILVWDNVIEHLSKKVI